MHYLVKYLDKLLKMKEDKGWKHLYFMVDVHNTIIKPTYDSSDRFEYFPYAQETLRLLSSRSDVKLIMWTSTYPVTIESYQEQFKDSGIIFDFVNENSDIKNDSIRYFDTKFFYDIGIDDKFGFEAEKDWKEVYEYLKRKGW